MTLEWTPADKSLIVVPKRNPKRAICPKCGGPRNRPGQRYCKRCHAEYQRQWAAERNAELHRLRGMVQLNGELAHETSGEVVR